MKVNTNQKIHCYTQVQQGIASILLIVCLLASLSLESALAAPKVEEATRSETTTSPLGQLASPSSRPVVKEIEYACPAKDPGRSLSRYARRYATTDDTAPLLGQLAEVQGSSLRQNAQDHLATADDTALQLLDQAAKEQNSTLRQALVSTLAYLATADDRTRQLLHQAAQEQDEDVREIALEALKVCNAASSTSHTDKKQVLQRSFKQAIATNNVLGLTELILENTDEVGELCESLAVDQLMEILPQTADTLLTWGVKHNQYKLVQLIIEHGRQHITTNDEKCVGQRVTKIAAEKGYQELFLLLINNAVDVDSRNITAFMSAIICGQYALAQAMIGLGEYRLEQPDNNGYTPQKQLKENQKVLQIFGEEKLQQQAKALEELLLQKFFKQAVAINDIPRLSKLILENTHEVGDLCESLEADLLRKTLPQTADTLLTWGVEHNKYELVQLIIEHGRQHITTNLRKCVGQSVTKIAAQRGYRELFLLLINNAVDVDLLNITAFMSAIICSEYELVQAMIRLGEYRLEQPDIHGQTPLESFQETFILEIPRERERKKQKEALEALLRQKIKTMNQNKPREKQQALLKKEQ